MKHVIPVMALLMAFSSNAQDFPVPYNPDGDANGLVGTPDLLSLLALFGEEFSAAVVSEDNQSAMLYMGDMSYPLCAMSCRNLPGMWELPVTEDLGLVWDEVYSTDTDIWTWLKPNPGSLKPNTFMSQDEVDLNWHSLIESPYIAREARCYCAIQELPHVEYTYCYGGAPTDEEFNACIQEKLAEGWYPLEGFPNHHDAHGYGNRWGSDNDWRVHTVRRTQASFWRWAE